MHKARAFFFVCAALSSLALLPARAGAQAPPYSTQWGIEGSGDGQFETPKAVAVHPAGYVYVADTGNHRIQKFTWWGIYITQWGGSGSGAGEFRNPRGVAVDRNGNVYVGDSDNHRVQKFSASGEYLTQWGSIGSGPGQFLYPAGLTADSIANIYVTDSNNHRIQVFTGSGTYLRQWGAQGSDSGQFQYPLDVAVDRSGNVYVADEANTRIQKFTNSGTYLTQWRTLSTDSPEGIAVDGEGRVYVACHGAHVVQMFSSTGTFLAEWGGEGSNPGEFRLPDGVEVDAHGGVYVADTYNFRIQAFGAEFGYPNLVATETPPGWTSPSVPRDDNAASAGDVYPTTQLAGNSSRTYVNWGIRQVADSTVPSWTDEVRLDGEEVLAGFTEASNDSHYVLILHNNVGPFMVRGGRHTLTSVADPLGSVAEPYEDDNQWSGQWVWSPLSGSREVPMVRAAPPDPGTLPLPNCDGLAFARDPRYAWVISMAPQNAGDDYDINLYDDYSGSMAGFSNLRASSTTRGGATDFVVGHAFNTPDSLYPGIVRYGVDGGAGPYVAGLTDSKGRTSEEAVARWGEQVLADNHLAHVYEGYFVSGQSYYFILRRTTGIAALNFEVLPGSVGGVYGRGGSGGTGQGIAVDSDRDTLTYTATTTGWHPVVVFRENGPETADSVVYTLAWDTQAILDASGPEKPASFELSGVRPNPVLTTAQVAFGLPVAADVRLDVYDLAGRQVRRLADGPRGAGYHHVLWDGRGDDGVRLGPGLYWVKLDVAGRVFSTNVVLLR